LIGTILPTGCNPKVKGLEIIHSLESEKRGPYYGIVGVVEPNENFAFSQNIRTIFRSGNQTYLWVGAAITRASNAMSEYEETQIKAQNTVCAAPLVVNIVKQAVYL
jgi:anthranilate synthase component I